MRRAVTLAAVLAGVLLPTAALAGPTTADTTTGNHPSTRVVSGVVTSFVTEGTDRSQLALVSRGDIVPVRGAALTEGAWVSARVADEPGPVDRVVEVLDERRVATGRYRATGTVRHQVYVAFAAPKGTSVRDSMPSPTEVARTINGKVSSYWSSQTGGQVTFRVAAMTKRYTSTHSCSDAWGLWEEATRKFGTAASGPNKHVVVVVPRTGSRHGCAAGMGSIGSSVSAGGVLYVSIPTAAIYAHELGHNMGLGHADSLLCDSRQDTVFSPTEGPRSPGCTHRSYDDYLEVMSSSGGTRGTGALNGAHVDDLGLLPSAIRKVPAGTSVTLRLAPLSGAVRSLRVAKVTESTGVNYYVQYRANTGIDANKSPYRLGVELHREDTSSYRSTGTLFLDATPSGHYDLDRSLPVGRTFTSASGKVTVEVLSQSSTGATVLIRNRV